MLLVANAHHDVVPFTLPAAGDDQAQARWTLLLDTQFAEPAHAAVNEYSAGGVYAELFGLQASGYSDSDPDEADQGSGAPVR